MVISLVMLVVTTEVLAGSVFVSVVVTTVSGLVYSDGKAR